MAGGAYTALSGLRVRIEQLDRIAGDIANVGTAGYKAERTTTVAANRPDFGTVLQTAVDVAPDRGDSTSGAAPSSRPDGNSISRSTAAASSRSRRLRASATRATASSM